jgi:inner membrane protein
MDPITHGVIGAALSAFSQEPVSLTNPMTIGAMLGAMSPDLDVVVRLYKDEMVYLKSHRGFSHSLPALVVYSALITAGISFFFPAMAVLQVFGFTLLGALSHTLFDILNSYGAQLFRKKIKANLLSLYDPFISLMALYLILNRDHTPFTLGMTALAFFGYLGLRYAMKRFSAGRVLKRYHDLQPSKITMLPSLKAFHKWDFVLETACGQTVGKYDPLKSAVEVVEKFMFEDDQDHFLDVFNRTNVGEYFKDFTPNYHIVKLEEAERIILKIIDLRYHFRDEFMHHATIHLDKELNVLHSYVHPYSLDKRIPVHEAA